MTTSELLAAHVRGDLGILKWHIDDFTEADMMVRPCDGANHANWQVGHVLGSTGRLLAMIDAGFKSPLPESLTGKYTKDSSSSNDPKAFATLAELRSALDTLGEAVEAFAKKIPQSTLEAPSPDWAKDWAPTNGLLLAGLASHVQMHVGQVQAIRRRLGKPHLM